MIIGTLNCSSTYEFSQQRIQPYENLPKVNKKRIYKLAKIIRNTGVDILCLQELDSTTSYYLSKRLKGRLITFVPHYDETSLTTLQIDPVKNTWKRSKRHIANTKGDYNSLCHSNHRFNYIGIYVSEAHTVDSIGYGTIDHRKGYIYADVVGVGRVITTHIPLGTSDRRSDESVRGREMFMSRVLESSINHYYDMPLYMAGDLNCLTSPEIKSQLCQLHRYGLSMSDAVIHYGMEGTWIGFNHEPYAYQRAMDIQPDDLFQTTSGPSTRMDVIASSNCPITSIHYALLRSRWTNEDRPLISDHALILHVYNMSIEKAVDRIHVIASTMCAINNPLLRIR